jgi:hypothetical protein
MRKHNFMVQIMLKLPSMLDYSSLKSSWVISHVNLELKTNVSEISSIRVDVTSTMMMETEISKTLIDPRKFQHVYSP